MAVPRIRVVALLLGVLAALFVWLVFAGVAQAAETGESATTSLSWHGVHFVVSGVVGVYTFITNTQKADREKVSALDTRVAKVETRLEQLWKDEDLRNLFAELKETRAQLKGATDALGTLSERFDRYEEHMISRGA